MSLPPCCVIHCRWATGHNEITPCGTEYSCWSNHSHLTITLETRGVRNICKSLLKQGCQKPFVTGVGRRSGRSSGYPPEKYIDIFRYFGIPKHLIDDFEKSVSMSDWTATRLRSNELYCHHSQASSQSHCATNQGNDPVYCCIRQPVNCCNCVKLSQGLSYGDRIKCDSIQFL